MLVESGLVPLQKPAPAADTCCASVLFCHLPQHCRCRCSALGFGWPVCEVSFAIVSLHSPTSVPTQRSFLDTETGSLLACNARAERDAHIAHNVPALVITSAARARLVRLDTCTGCPCLGGTGLSCDGNSVECRRKTDGELNET